MTTPFITVRQLADRLAREGVPTRVEAIRKWIERGKIDVKRSRAGRVYVTRDEAEKVIAWRRPQ